MLLKSQLNFNSFLKKPMYNKMLPKCYAYSMLKHREIKTQNKQFEKSSRCYIHIFLISCIIPDACFSPASADNLRRTGSNRLSGLPPIAFTETWSGGK
jgi:hypothetical protein